MPRSSTPRLMHVRGPTTDPVDSPPSAAFSLPPWRPGLSPARAGGGPENLFLVVELRRVATASPWPTRSWRPAAFRRSTSSCCPGRAARRPPRSTGSVTRFSRRMLRGIDSRRLAPQIDCIVYSADFPWRIDYREALSPDIVQQDTFPSGSLTGMTMLYGAVQSGSAGLARSREQQLLPAARTDDGVPVGDGRFSQLVRLGRRRPAAGGGGQPLPAVGDARRDRRPRQHRPRSGRLPRSGGRGRRHPPAGHHLPDDQQRRPHGDPLGRLSGDRPGPGASSASRRRSPRARCRSGSGTSPA